MLGKSSKCNLWETNIRSFLLPMLRVKSAGWQTFPHVGMENGHLVLLGLTLYHLR